jgi:hypothetical protein
MTTLNSTSRCLILLLLLNHYLSPLAKEWMVMYPSPEYDHVLFDAASASAFVQQLHPHWQQLYTSAPRDVQRSDVLRLLLLWRRVMSARARPRDHMTIRSYGGYYFDCDTQPQHSLPLGQLFQKYPGKSAFVFEESVLSVEEAAAAAQHEIRGGAGEMRQRVANYAMVCRCHVAAAAAGWLR